MGMETLLTVLQCGKCEPLKAGVHATALGLFVVMGAYNAAAWLVRRDSHLAINAIMYSMLTVWEQQHVAHHLAAVKHDPDTPQTQEVEVAAVAHLAA